MIKVAVAGRVKTRLASEIGAAEAVRFYRATAAAVIGRLARDPRFETILAVAPDTGVASPALPPRLQCIRQGVGDIGARMQRCFDVLPPGPVVLVGTDIPAIRAAMIADAFARLGSHDIVFGPATDGGFWLVGMRRTPKVLGAFKDVRWSAPETLADCRRGLAGLRIATIAMLGDVDNARDLAQQHGLAGRRISSPFPAKQD